MRLVGVGVEGGGIGQWIWSLEPHKRRREYVSPRCPPVEDDLAANVLPEARELLPPAQVLEDGVAQLLEDLALLHADHLLLYGGVCVCVDTNVGG